MTDADFAGVLNGDVTEWLQALPAYQHKLLTSMLVDHDPAEVAVAWLSSPGPANTAPFGAVKLGASKFYANLLIELKKLICESDSYKQERSEILKSAQTGKMFVISSVSVALAPHVGAAAAVIGPAIALTLAVLSTAGKASACEMLTQMIADREKQ